MKFNKFITLIMLLIFCLLFLRQYNDSVNAGESVIPQAPGSPKAPNNLEGILLIVFYQPQIYLRWSDNSDDEDLFGIEFKPDDADWLFLDSVGSNVTTYTHINILEGKTYCYRVYAQNSAGLSDYSNSVCITVPYIPPAAPSQLTTASYSDSAILLIWKDNSVNETEFGIDYQIGESGWSVLNTVPSNQTTYLHTGLSSNHIYCYRVYAINTGGQSDYSNSACGQTLPKPVSIDNTIWLKYE